MIYGENTALCSLLFLLTVPFFWGILLTEGKIFKKFSDFGEKIKGLDCLRGREPPKLFQRRKSGYEKMYLYHVVYGAAL